MRVIPHFMRTSYDLETFVDFPPFRLSMLERKLSGWRRDLVFLLYSILTYYYIAVLDDSYCSTVLPNLLALGLP